MAPVIVPIVITPPKKPWEGDFECIQEGLRLVCRELPDKISIFKASLFILIGFIVLILISFLIWSILKW